VNYKERKGSHKGSGFIVNVSGETWESRLESGKVAKEQSRCERRGMR
jgi:hypothetical protein